MLEFLLETGSGQMTTKDFSKDTLDDVVSGSIHSNGGEIALQTKVYCEGA